MTRSLKNNKRSVSITYSTGIPLEIIHCQEIRCIGNMYVFTQKLQPLVGANLTIKWGSIRT